MIFYIIHLNHSRRALCRAMYRGFGRMELYMGGEDLTMRSREPLDFQLFAIHQKMTLINF